MTIKLQKFREKLYMLFPKRKDAIMNLLDALTCQGHQYKSIVQLSNGFCFERQYSSITDAIADGLPYAKWNDIRKHVYVNADIDIEPIRFVVDCTPNPRPHAKKLAERYITHLPNPTPGNKPICVGNQYSVVTLLPNKLAAEQKHWVIPLSAKKVTSTQKGNEAGIEQIVDNINELGLADKMSISIGDTLYGTEKCRIRASQQKNLVHIFRLNSKRNIYFSPTEQRNKLSKKGRKKEFGIKMHLNDITTHIDCCQQEKTTYKNRNGKEYSVIIKCWKNALLRGSRKFRSSQHPFNLIQIKVINEKGNEVFKRPLWIAVFGNRRHEIGLIDAYKNYVSRYDIEHFFRFSKRNLLMNSYQTPDFEHEEYWWQFCTLAYMQLYLAKEFAFCLPQPWERYLPEYKNKKYSICSPSQTQRGFSDLLKKIGTPAKNCVPRGKPRGRMAGETQEKRADKPVIFKAKKTAEKTTKTIFSESEPTDNFSNPQKIDEFLATVKLSLKELDITPAEFSKMLINSS